MVVTSNALEKLLLDKLKASNIVDHILLSSVLDGVSSDVLNRLVATPCKIEATGNGLTLTDPSGDIITCPK